MNFPRSIVPLLAGSCFFLPGMVRGNTTADADGAGVTVLDSLAVQDVGDPNGIEPESQNRAEAVTIIEGKELRGRSQSLNDIVNRVAGVKVRQTGGLGSSSKVSIHGLEGKRIMILVDGSPIESLDGNFGINDIPVDFIDHIEVYKGYVPARFGGDGMGGAINVVIREFNTNYIDGSYSVASHNTHRATWLLKRNFPGIGKKDGLVELGFGGFYNYSDNDYSFKSPYVDTLTITRDHDAYESLVLAGAGRIRNYWFDEIKAEVAYYDNEKEIQGVGYAIRDAKTQSNTWLVSAKAQKEGLASGRLDLEYEMGWQYAVGRNIDTAHVRYRGWDSSQYIASAQPLGELGDYPSLSRSVQKTLDQSLNFDYRFTKSHALNWNTRVGYTTYRNRDSLGSAVALYNVAGYPGNLTTGISGLSLESDFGKGRFVNLLGFKGYYYQSKATATVATLQGTPAAQSVDHTGIGYDESFRFKIVEPLFFKAGYQHSLRLPDSDELFGNGIAIASSPGLGPEVGDNFFGGLLFDSWSVPLLARVQYEINGFYMNIRDMIKLQNGGPNGAAYYNMEGVDILGFDTELKVDCNEYLYGYMNLTFQNLRNTRYLQSVGVATGHVVPNIPRFFMNYGLELHTADMLYNRDFAKIFWNASYTDEFYYNWQISSKQNRVLPASFVQDAGVEYSIRDNQLSWSAEVLNLMNRQVYDEFRLPKPGRTFATKIRFSIMD
jgi:vitamin B12 transporter